MIIFRSYKTYQCHGSYLDRAHVRDNMTTCREDGFAEYTRHQKFRYFLKLIYNQTNLAEVSIINKQKRFTNDNI